MKKIRKITAVMCLLALVTGLMFALFINSSAAVSYTNVKTDGTFYNGTIADDPKYYRFTIPSDGKINVKNILYTRANCALLNEDYEVVAGLGDPYYTQGSENSPKTSNFEYILSKGIYYLKWSKVYDGKYSFNIQFSSFNTTENEPNALANPDRITRGQTIVACFTTQDDNDWFVFDIPAKANVTVTAIRYNNCAVSVLNEDFEELSALSNHDGGYWSKGTEDSPSTTKAELELVKGKYYIKATKNTDGKYEIKLDYNIILPEVENLQVKGTSKSAVKLGWSKASGVNGYAVQQKIDGKWTKVANTTSNIYTVSNLKSGTKNNFRVRVYKVIDGVVYYGNWNYINGYTNGWMKANGYYYYLKNNAFVKGWQKITNSKGNTYKYYFGTDGVMKTGWQKIKNAKGVTYQYHFGTNGVMDTGWKKITNSKGKTYQYHFKANGVMDTGWQKITNSKGATYQYHFQANGVMDTGWKSITNSKGKTYKYYFKADGVMLTGWQKLKASNGKYYWYYFQSNGVNVINKNVKIGKKVYKFNKSGICTNP